MKKISAIAKIYARRIKENSGVITIDDVPDKWKEEVIILLSEEIRDMKEDIKGNANRITKLELDKERELLQQERKEFLNNKGD